jgi:hypothetical protein
MPDDQVDARRERLQRLEAVLSPKPATQPIMRTGRHLSQTDGLCTLYRVTGDAGDDWTQHECVGMAKTPEIAEAICEAVNARGIPLPAADRSSPLPTAAQIRAWLLTHGWEFVSSGSGGSLWRLTGGAEPDVVVPHGDGDSMATSGALKRIASRSHLSLDSLTREMRRLLHG